MKRNFRELNISEQINKQYTEQVKCTHLYFKKYRYLIIPSFIVTSQFEYGLRDNDIIYLKHDISDQIPINDQPTIIITTLSFLNKVVEALQGSQVDYIFVLKLNVVKLNKIQKQVCHNVQQFESVSQLLKQLIYQNKKLFYRNQIWSFSDVMEVNNNNVYVRNRYIYYLWYYSNARNVKGAKEDLLKLFSMLRHDDEASSIIQRLEEVPQKDIFDYDECLYNPHVRKYANVLIRSVQCGQMLVNIRMILTYLHKLSLTDNKVGTKKWYGSMNICQKGKQMIKQGNYIMSIAILKLGPQKTDQNVGSRYMIQLQYKQGHINYCYDNGIIYSLNAILILPTTLFKINNVLNHKIELSLVTQRRIHTSKLQPMDKILINYNILKQYKNSIADLGDVYMLTERWKQAELFDKHKLQQFSKLVDQPINYMQDNIHAYNTQIQSYLIPLFYKLSIIYMAMHDYKTAYKYMMCVYRRRQKHRHLYHSITNNLGLICKKMNRKSQSIGYFSKNMIQAYKNNDHVGYVTAALNIQQIRPQNPTLLKECLLCTQKLLNEHKNSNEVNKCKGYVLFIEVLRRSMERQNHQRKDKIVVLNSILQMYQLVFGRQHSKSLEIMAEIGREFEEIKEIQNAIIIYEQCRTLYQQIQLYTLNYVYLVLRLSLIYFNVRQLNLSKQLLCRLVKVGKGVFRVNNNLQVQCLWQLGIVYQEEGNTSQAFRYFLHAYKRITPSTNQDQLYYRIKYKIGLYTNNIVKPVQVFCEQY